MRRQTADISTNFDITGIREAIENVRALTGSISQSLEGLSGIGALDGLNGGLGDASIGAEELAQRINAAAQAGTAIGELTRLLEQMAEQAANAGEATEEVDGEGLDDAARAARRAGNQIDEAGDETQTLGRRLGDVARRARDAGRALASSFGSAALGGLRSAAGLAVQAAGLGSVLSGLGGGVVGASFATLAETTSDYILDLEKLSRLTGIEVTALSRLANTAKGTNVDLDDLRGSFVQFAGQLASAAAGESAREYFEELGVSAVDAEGKTKDTLTALLEVARAQRRLGAGADRAAILSALFGEDDSAKVISFLGQIGGELDDVAAFVDRLDRTGNVVTQDDVDVAARYRLTMGSLSDAVSGIGRDIARAVLPNMAEFGEYLETVIEQSRDGIVNVAVRAWKLLSGVIQDVIRYFRGDQEFIRNKWVITLGDLVRGAARAFATLGRAALEFGEILAGAEPDDRAWEFPWLFTLRDRLTAFASNVERIARAVGRAFAAMGLTALENAGGIERAVGTATDNIVNLLGVLAGTEEADTFLGGVAQEAIDLVGWLDRLRQAIVALWNGEEVSPEFAWIATFAATVEETRAALNVMAEVVTDVMRSIGGFLESIGVTEEGVSSLTAKILGWGIVLAAVLVPLKAVLGLLAGLGLAAAGPAIAVAALAAAVGVMAYNLYEQIKASREADQALRDLKEFSDTAVEQYGVRQAGTQAYLDTQEERRARGLDADAPGRVPRGGGVTDYYERGADGEWRLVRTTTEDLARTVDDLAITQRIQTDAQAALGVDMEALTESLQTNAAATRDLIGATGGDGADVAGLLAAVEGAGAGNAEAILRAARSPVVSVPAAATGTPAMAAPAGDSVSFTVQPSGQVVAGTMSPPGVARQLLDEINRAQRAAVTQRAPQFAVRNG